MKLDKRVLITTAYIKEGEYYDYVEKNTSSSVRFSAPRTISYGLRFIKQNIPEIEVLEYPTWNEYVKKIQEGWDIVGFSFYLNETCEILQMIEYARGKGIKEIWGGNYGILTESVKQYFDKIFIGYSEFDIAAAIDKKIDILRHPPLIEYIDIIRGIKIKNYGNLFTTRGCSIGCTFCHTPLFCPKPSKIPLESIEEVLIYYKKCGIRMVAIMDENFGILKNHAEDVISLLHKYNFYWGCMTRVDFLKKNIENWLKKGFYLAALGVENLNQENLDSTNKKEKVEETIEVLRLLKDLSTIGYYIIGFENDTVKSIKADIKRLKKLKMLAYQICILTPLPQTPLWNYLDKKYGIFEKDWHKFDAKHLVWNHPNISPDEMEKLLSWCFTELNLGMPFRYIQRRYKLHKRGMKISFREWYQAQTFDYNKQHYL